MEAVRFFGVTFLGLVLDMTVAWTVARVLVCPLWLAAAVGFSFAAAANYVLHELWTFRTPATGGHLSVVRALRYGITLGVTLLVRVGSVAAIVAVLGDSQPLAVLVGGAGISFCVHYFISKKFVFSRPCQT